MDILNMKIKYSRSDKQILKKLENAAIFFHYSFKLNMIWVTNKVNNANESWDGLKKSLQI